MPARRTPLSLLITGVAGVWAAGEREVRSGGERYGLILMVLSAASFALMAAVAKKLLPHTPTQAVVLSRGLIVTLFFVIVARRQKIPLVGSRRGMLVIRGLLGYMALSFYFYSVQHLPLGDAVLLQYSNPIFVAALAPWVMKEHTGRWHWPLVLTALLGIALIVGPAGELRGQALIGVCGSLCSGLAYLVVRQLARTEHALTIMIAFPAMTIPGSLIASIHAGRAALPHDWVEVFGHLAVSATGLAGQWALTHGLMRVPAARATAMTMSGPVFGLLFGFLLFGTIPGLTSVAGTSIVIAALILLAKLRSS